MKNKRKKTLILKKKQNKINNIFLKKEPEMFSHEAPIIFCTPEVTCALTWLAIKTQLFKSALYFQISN